MKSTKSLMIAACAVLIATIFSGCSKPLTEEELLNNYNCNAHPNLLNKKFPDFLKKCEERKLGKFSDIYLEYKKVTAWTFDMENRDPKKAAELKAKMDEWSKEPNKLPKEEIDKLEKQYPLVSALDVL